MLKQFFSACIFLLAGLFYQQATAQSRNLTGVWEGKVTVHGQDLRIIYHLRKSGSGYVGTFDSPDQGASDLELDKIDFSNDSLHTVLNAAKLVYSAYLKDNITLDGELVQAGKTRLPLVLKLKTRAIYTSNKRPQTPKPPFSYRSEDVSFLSANNTISFAGTLTLPDQKPPYTTAILISGSGQQDRDETIEDHKPFAVLADTLTKSGYAVLRIDDRGVGQTTGANTLATATTADFAKDIEAALAYLATRKDISPKRIGLIGHSEGSLIAAIVAARNPKISFVISLAGAGVSGKDILYRQQTEVIQKAGLLSAQAFDAYSELTYQTLGMIHDFPDASPTALETKGDALLSKWSIKYSTAIVNEVSAKLGLNQEGFRNVIKSETRPWLHYFIATEPSQFWKHVKCQTLLLNGEKDIQIYPYENITAIEKALKDNGNKKVAVQVFPGLNHLFQHCRSCTVQEYGEIEETFAPETYTYMINWLNGAIGK